MISKNTLCRPLRFTAWFYSLYFIHPPRWGFDLNGTRSRRRPNEVVNVEQHEIFITRRYVEVKAQSAARMRRVSGLALLGDY